MDTNRITYFCAVVQTGNLRKAAQLLRISPPALSKAIKVLEQEVGIELLVPRGRNIEVTPLGRKFAKRATEWLKDYAHISKELLSEARASKPTKIATFEVFSTYFLNTLAETGVLDESMVLHDVLPGQLERAIVDGTVDYGITYMPIPTPGVEYLKVVSIEMGVFTGVGAFTKVPQQDLPFVVPAQPFSGTPSRVQGLDGWPEDAYHRHIRYEVTLMESAFELCRLKKAAGYFPAFVVRLHNDRVKPQFQLERRPTPYGGRKCMTDVFLVLKKGNKEDVIAKKLARALRSLT